MTRREIVSHEPDGDDDAADQPSRNTLASDRDPSAKQIERQDGMSPEKYESIAAVASRLPTMMPHQVSSTITFGPRNSTTAMKKTSNATKKITSENSSDDSVSHASSSNPPAIPNVMNAPKWINEYSSANSASP